MNTRATPNLYTFSNKDQRNINKLKKLSKTYYKIPIFIYITIIHENEK